MAVPSSPDNVLKAQPQQSHPHRVLVGAELDAAELPLLGARWEVEVHSDAAALVRRSMEESIVLVLIDRTLPNLSPDIITELTARRERSAPLVFLSHATVFPSVSRLVRMLEYFHLDEGEVAGALPWAVASALAFAVGSADESRSMQESPLSRLVAGSRSELSPTDPNAMSLLVRPRTREEDSVAHRLALEVSFRERERLLNGSLSTQEVASLLRVTRQTPHDRVKARTLLAVEDKGTLKFPPWQFDAEGPAGVVRGLSEVLQALTVSRLAQVRWLQRPNPIFDGQSPLEALKAGLVDRVVREARSVGAAAGNG